LKTNFQSHLDTLTLTFPPTTFMWLSAATSTTGCGIWSAGPNAPAASHDTVKRVLATRHLYKSSKQWEALIIINHTTN